MWAKELVEDPLGEFVEEEEGIHDGELQEGLLLLSHDGQSPIDI